MSRELYKMNLISVVQKLPSEDIETVQGYVEMIESENRELKKQLEEKTKTGVANHKYASKCEDKVITMENQQKEFVKYLENKINFTAMNMQAYTLDIYQLILEKYKEIIGENNE